MNKRERVISKRNHFAKKDHRRRERRDERVTREHGGAAHGACGRKVRFQCAPDAREFAATHGYARQVPYRCRYCGGWHLTSRPWLCGEMRLRELFAEARHSARRIRELEAAKAVVMEPRARTGMPIAKGTVLDPMRHVDEGLEARADMDFEMAELGKVVDEARTIAAGVRALYYRDAARYLELYYLEALPLKAVARELGCPERHIAELDRITFEDCERIGWAALKEAGREC